MGKRQAYRGNPELKQYHLIQDFSGGMDTVSIDETMKDNEFRMMKNVELKEKGLAQNRKGFGELKNLSQWFDIKSFFLDSGDISVFKVVKNTGDVLGWAEEYVHYSDFETQMNTQVYALHILMLVSNGTSAELSVLKIFREEAGVATIEKISLITNNNFILNKGNRKNTDTVTIIDKVYFSLNDLSKNRQGIGVYDVENETFSMINGNTAYQPTPFEVDALGFNVLRNNPLTDVVDQGFGDVAITGIYLTDPAGNYIKNIPLDGNFKINAFQIGAELKPSQVKITILNQAGVELNFELVEAGDGGGYFWYNVENLKMDGVTSVDIKLSQKLPGSGEIEINAISNIYSGVGNYYKATGKLYLKEALTYETDSYTYKATDYTRAVIDDLLVITDAQVGDIAYVTETESYYTCATASPNPTWDLIVIQESVSYLIDLIPTLDKVYNVDGAKWVWNGISTYTSIDFSELTPLLTYEASYITYPDAAALESALKVIGYFYYITADDKYYTFVEPGVLKEVDASALVIPGELLPFQTTFFVGSNDDIDKVESINLTGVKLLKMGDRLAYYKGNSIYFSEIFQYNYIPNTNFVLLPLDSTDEITKIKYFRGVWIIFTKTTIWRMKGSLFGADFSIEKVNDFIGCVAPNSVKAVNNNLVFLSKNGVYSLTQNYYQDGLENVKKLDKQIENLVKVSEDAYGLVYRDQYWLFLPQAEEFDILKYYYDVEKAGRKERPFSVDKYIVEPDIINIVDGTMYSIKDGYIYAFDLGYTDFLPHNALEEDIPEYNYPYRIVTRDEDFSYPTHDKKMKSLIIKTIAELTAPLIITVYFNGKAIIDPKTYTVSVNEYGEIIYDTTGIPNLIIDPASTLGTFELGKNALGDGSISTHKFVLGNKCKNVTIDIEQTSKGRFGLLDIGYIFKLGKVRENR